uniref:Fibrinogen C-terminal domain-containing protein n=1 Tax=Catharus ustulatus TaxID=91951 RepID=A0A8C3TYQ7_CATUS
MIPGCYNLSLDAPRNPRILGNSSPARNSFPSSPFPVGAIPWLLPLQIPEWFGMGSMDLQSHPISISIPAHPGIPSQDPTPSSPFPVGIPFAVSCPSTLYPKWLSSSPGQFHGFEFHFCGGWTVIQRRQDGSVDFNRTWNEYKEGFGDLNGEFWLGNDNIHRVTSQGDYSLRIDMEDWNNKHKHAFYQVFSIEDEENFYRLHVDGFSGTVEDSFAWYHDKRSFSTPDSGNICAEISHGGWWYHQCFFSNLNGGGRYSIKNRKMLGPDGIVWYSWKDTDYYSLRKVVMMIRPRTFRPHLSP